MVVGASVTTGIVVASTGTVVAAARVVVTSASTVVEELATVVLASSMERLVSLLHAPRAAAAMTSRPTPVRRVRLRRMFMRESP